MFRLWLHIIAHLILLAEPAICALLILLAWLIVDNLVLTISLTISAIAVGVIVEKQVLDRLTGHIPTLSELGIGQLPHANAWGLSFHLPSRAEDIRPVDGGPS